MSQAKKPSVVFVDHARWGTFSQLAAYLRRSGVRTVRVTLSRDAWFHKLIDSLLYNRVIHVDEAGLAALGPALADEHVVDVQCTEYVVAQVCAGDLDALDPAVARAVRARGMLLDKYVVGDLAGSRGVRVPEKLDASTISADEAVERFGLPLVLKARIGASGDRVAIPRTRAEVDEALIRLGPDLQDLFYERYIAGEYIDYSAVVGPDGPVLEVVTRSVATGSAGTTPPSSIEIVDEPALLAFGRLAVEKLGFTGITHMDTVRDANGDYWLLDLNLRAWGSMFSCRAAGIDFGAGYRHTLGLVSARPPQTTGRPGIITVFPGIVDDQIREGKIGATLLAFARHSPRSARQLGPRYWFAQAIASAVGVWGARSDRKAARRA